MAGDRAVFTLPTVTVVICAYTEQRWDQLVQAVASARVQSRPPVEVVVSIDHNVGLLERATAYWANDRDAAVPVLVIANRFAGRLGSARTTASEIARGEVLAFLDDDAEARSDWLEVLVAPYCDADVVAVGGAPVPRWETHCPKWFPPEFRWVFGCAYLGMPTVRKAVRHLIGANMSVRRSALRHIEGFHSDNHDDMDMCHRLVDAFPDGRILFEPAALVDHWVGRERTTWHYFCRRCFLVNRGKVEAFRSMGSAGNWTAEIDFVRTRLPASAWRGLEDALGGDAWGLVRVGAFAAGTALAGAGSLSGQLDAKWSKRSTGRSGGTTLANSARTPGRGTPRWLLKMLGGC